MNPRKRPVDRWIDRSVFEHNVWVAHQTEVPSDEEVDEARHLWKVTPSPRRAASHALCGASGRSGRCNSASGSRCRHLVTCRICRLPALYHTYYLDLTRLTRVLLSDTSLPRIVLSYEASLGLGCSFARTSKKHGRQLSFTRYLVIFWLSTTICIYFLHLFSWSWTGINFGENLEVACLGSAAVFGIVLQELARAQPCQGFL